MFSGLVNFFKSKSAPGIVLCCAALFGMILKNSPLSDAYGKLKEMPGLVQIGDFVIDKPLLLWVNDGLMAIFFLMIGLEIKRELILGHLSKKEHVVLPAVAAIGGVIVPAIIYVIINWTSTGQSMRGWAIPAATDIAFALGILIILGNIIPPALKVTLVAIAIIDDVIAIIIIALFYTTDTSMISLSLAGFGLFLAFLMNRSGVTRLGPYIVLGIFIWACVLKSGVHATLAGVALGTMIPLRQKNAEGKSPLKILEHALDPWVAFFILPVFAFANAGVSIIDLKWEDLLNPITLGITFGLFFGKQIGVMLMAFLFTSLKLCTLPHGVSWLQFYGMAILTGVGFTMSLFIGTLAFTDNDYFSSVRIGVLLGSILSVIAGVTVLKYAAKKANYSH